MSNQSPFYTQVRSPEVGAIGIDDLDIVSRFLSHYGHTQLLVQVCQVFYFENNPNKIDIACASMTALALHIDSTQKSTRSTLVNI